MTKQNKNHRIICGSVAVLMSRTLYNDQLCIILLLKQNSILWQAFPFKLIMNIGKAKTNVQINKKIASLLIKPRYITQLGPYDPYRSYNSY